MSRHLSEKELEDFRRKRSDPQELLRMDRHLADCAGCSANLRALSGGPLLPELAAEMSGPLHPAYEELTAYLDESLASDVGERVKYHLLICASCAAEVRDLRVLDRAMDVPVANPVAAPEPERDGWLDWLRTWSLRPGFAVASVAMLLVGLSLITRVQLTRPEDTGSQIIRPDSPAGDGNGLLYLGVAIVVAGLVGLIHRSRK
jgi:anti-sigma factor RsiW